MRGPAFLGVPRPSVAHWWALLRYGTVASIPSGGVCNVDIGDYTFTLPHLSTPVLGEGVWCLFAGRTGLVLKFGGCATVSPNGATAVEDPRTSIGAPPLVGAASYVEAVTDFDDASYVQQQASGADYGWIKWTLPATAVGSNVVSVTVNTRHLYDPTTIVGSTSVDPGTITNDCSIRLVAGAGSTQVPGPWPATFPEGTPADYEYEYPLPDSDVDTWVAALQAGTAEVWTVQGGDSIGRETRHNIYELSVTVCWD